MAVRLFELLSICLDTELAPVDVLASLMTFLLGHSLAGLVGNTFTVLLSDGLALLLRNRSRDREIEHYFIDKTLLPASLSRLLVAHIPGNIVTFLHRDLVTHLPGHRGTLLLGHIHTVLSRHVATLLMGNGCKVEQGVKR